MTAAAETASTRDLFAKMADMDRVREDLNLFIGGLFAMRAKETLQKNNITHVVSVMRGKLSEKQFAPFKHLRVELDDEDDENLLEHFPETNRFIREGLHSGGGVFVHCHMGKSRSATVVLAYLLASSPASLPSVFDVLTTLRAARPFVEPNAGFMRQLNIYHEMGAPFDAVEGNGRYHRWVYQERLKEARKCKTAPELEWIRFEDESDDGNSDDTKSGKGESELGSLELRCRKCRRELATAQYLAPHSRSPLVPFPTQSSASVDTANNHTSGQVTTKCAHYFLEPLSWMRPELEKGLLEGRLECPGRTVNDQGITKIPRKSGAGGCGANVGKYAWQGMQCSCGRWTVPAITLARSKVDEIGGLSSHGRGRGADASGDGNETDAGLRVRGEGEDGGSSATLSKADIMARIRMPPGMRSDTQNGKGKAGNL